MKGHIRGINKTSLWSAWKQVRKELRNSSVRDVIDHLEYDINPDVWINRLLVQIEQGTYEPERVRRFSLAKGSGFNRRMSLPTIPDIVLYRAIADHIYRKAKVSEQEHVYFHREFISQVKKQAEDRALEEMPNEAISYNISGKRSFLQWLYFNQYRKQLILEKIHPYLVLTDITNFFDSVLHAKVAEALRAFSIPPRMLGLLFFLLERLAIREDYGDSPRIGLVVDEFGCSRTIAHLLLFSHDQRMVKLVGRDSYVRWMDDQVLGVESKAKGLSTLTGVAESLAHLHLTPNARKSQILSLEKAKRHFHLDLNELLDHIETLPHNTPKEQRHLRKSVMRVWSEAEQYEGKGEWDKVLKRIYRFAGLACSRVLRKRALKDLLEKPELAERIANYMRCTGTTTQYLNFVQKALNHEEQVYPSVSHVLIESLLRLEATGDEAVKVRKIGSDLVSRKSTLKGISECKEVAPLLLLRFGDRRSLPLLRKCFEPPSDRNPSGLIRAAAIVYASFGLGQYGEVRKSAATLLRNPLSETVRLIESIGSYPTVPDRYEARLTLRKDSVAGIWFIDMRTVLAARLLALSQRRQVQVWIKEWKQRVLMQNVSDFDRHMIRKFFPQRRARPS